MYVTRYNITVYSYKCIDTVNICRLINPILSNSDSNVEYFLWKFAH